MWERIEAVVILSLVISFIAALVISFLMWLGDQ